MSWWWPKYYMPKASFLRGWLRSRSTLAWVLEVMLLRSKLDVREKGNPSRTKVVWWISLQTRWPFHKWPQPVWLLGWITQVVSREKEPCRTGVLGNLLHGWILIYTGSDWRKACGGLTWDFQWRLADSLARPTYHMILLVWCYGNTLQGTEAGLTSYSNRAFA